MLILPWLVRTSQWTFSILLSAVLSCLDCLICELQTAGNVWRTRFLSQLPHRKVDKERWQKVKSTGLCHKINLMKQGDTYAVNCKIPQACLNISNLIRVPKTDALLSVSKSRGLRYFCKIATQRLGPQLTFCEVWARHFKATGAS